eukprot:TRINITY_DN56215_c0_g1_i1.p1 TRINITY_DN56215_c0_g1~~TRINITY_DN56215_c0_g1_i1.p1  ORF type:complete len:161 (+),score=14.63 TRINITY_DN56215_c0_g1_i1:74-484(+)
MARVPPLVAHQILVMAEDRANVIRRELGVPGLVDYNVQIEWANLEQPRFLRVMNKNLVVCGQKGLEIRPVAALGLGCPVLEHQLLNVFAACGYDTNVVQRHIHSMTDWDDERDKVRLMRVLKVPAKFALENVRSLT